MGGKGGDDGGVSKEAGGAGFTKLGMGMSEWSRQAIQAFQLFSKG